MWKSERDDYYCPSSSDTGILSFDLGSQCATDGVARVGVGMDVGESMCVWGTGVGLGWVGSLQMMRKGVLS